MEKIISNTIDSSTTPKSLVKLVGVGGKLASKVVKWFNYEGQNETSPYHQRYVKEKQFTDYYIVTKLLPENPYILLEVDGFGFPKVDKIAIQHYGIKLDDPRRHEYGNRYVLLFFGVLSMDKYTYHRRKNGLTNQLYQFEGVEVDKNIVWLPEELEAERQLSRHYLNSISELPQHYLLSVGESNYGDVEPSLSRSGLPEVIDREVQQVARDGSLNAEQELALTAFLRDPVMVLTGGAGTGKTHTVASMAKLGKRLNMKTVVMAFSGKAAQRSQEAMREAGVDYAECCTIHRGLGLGGRRNSLGGSNGEPLAIEGKQIVVLDESSMIPNWLFAAVVKALPKDAHLVLVGDPNQLPPIGYGKPFETYLELGIPHVHLEQNYRQKDQQSIFTFAEAIRRRQPELFQDTGVGVKVDYEVSHDDVGEILGETVDRFKAEYELMEWQAVTWKNEVKESINLALQDSLNPEGEALYFYTAFDLGKDEVSGWPIAEVREGDKIMVTKNNYRYMIFNGETGIVKGQKLNNDKKLCIEIAFPDRTVLIEKDDAESLVRLGYCVTVHKSQGSGWKGILIYQPSEVAFNPTRFFYTAATRAQLEVHLVTTESQGRFWGNATEREKYYYNTLKERVQEFSAKARASLDDKVDCE